MKKLWTEFRAFVGRTGTYFLITMLFFGIVALIATEQNFDRAMLWSSMLFAVLTALADFIEKIAFISSANVKRILRALLVVASFAFSFVAVTDVIENDRTALIGIAVFALFELLLTAVRCLVASAKAKKKSDASAYRNLFTPQDGE